MTFLERAGIGFLVLVGIGVVMAVSKPHQPQPKISIHCESRGDSGSCVVTETGGARAELDTNVVLVCHDGEHIAHVGAIVEANSHVTKIVEGFEPSVGLLSNCAGIDYRDTVVKAAGPT